MNTQRQPSASSHGVVLVAALVLTLSGCAADAPDSTRQQFTQKASALEMMEVVFVGEHPRAAIQARMDTALELYGLPRNEGEYEHAGSVLVDLRKQTDVPEMDILRCVIASHVEGINMQFASTAALCATQLSL